MANKIVHVEINTQRPKKLLTFYEDVFGWKSEKIPKMQCWTAVAAKRDKKGTPTERGVVNSSIMKMPGRKGMGIMIEVSNIKSHLRKMEAHGGKSLGKPMDMGEMGWYAWAKDPEGNPITLWQQK